MVNRITLSPSGAVVATAHLSVRAGRPDSLARIVRQVEPGASLTVRGIVTGSVIGGNAQWYEGLGQTYFWSGDCSQLSAPGSGIPVLAGSVESARAGALGFDRNKPLSVTDVEEFRARNFEFCIRYISRHADKESPNDLTREEAERILDGGLALMVVQHVAPRPWLPTPDLGWIYGERAVTNAHRVGLPPGVNVFLDLEGVRADVKRQNVIDYCNNWFEQVDGAGFSSGLYVGADIVISGDDLYWDLKTRHYWKSGSRVPDIPHRGYQMTQRILPHADDDANVDADTVRVDAFGETVQWLIRK